MTRDERSEISARGRRSRARQVVRAACLLAAVGALWPFTAEVGSLRVVPSLSPFVAVSAGIAARAVPLAAWLGIVVGVVAMFQRRVLCRWICPTGLCLEGANWLGRRLKRNPGRWPSIGRWIVLLTLGGACLGYPLLLWLDPLALFAGVFTTFGLAAVVAFTILWPGLWCGRLCPLGAFQDLLHAGFASVRSLFVGKRDGNEEAGLSRRVVLGAAAGAGSAAILCFAQRNDAPALRPPNARTGPQFLGLCTRCGNCVRVCPTGVIEHDVGGHGLASLLTPVLSFRRGYCREDCTRCGEVCPSGAIRPLPVRDKATVRIGLPRVDRDVCLLSEDRECSACARWCPYGAIRYVFSEESYSLQVKIDPQKCNGCGACEAACPTKPRKAIVVLPV